MKLVSFMVCSLRTNEQGERKPSLLQVINRQPPPPPAGLNGLTCTEVQHLFGALRPLWCRQRRAVRVIAHVVRHGSGDDKDQATR